MTPSFDLDVMVDSTIPKVTKWPFVLGDILLLGIALLVVNWGHAATTPWHYLISLLSVAAGAWLLCTPFLLEHRAAERRAEANGLASTVEQINQLHNVAEQIRLATSQWQTVQELSVKTNQSAKEISDRMTAEAQSFAEFLNRAQDSERAHLRLEVEKLRRVEGDWLQVMVRTLDHVHALFQAGVRSGQSQLIDQLGQFQNACRDAARRVGLVPFAPDQEEPFEPKLHQLADEKAVAPAGALIAGLIAPGYTFQGQLLRRAVVALDAPLPRSPLSISEINQQRAHAAGHSETTGSLGSDANASTATADASPSNLPPASNANPGVNDPRPGELPLNG